MRPSLCKGVEIGKGASRMRKHKVVSMAGACVECMFFSKGPSFWLLMALASSILSGILKSLLVTKLCEAPTIHKA